MNRPLFSQTNGAFTMTCAVKVDIRATPQIVWELLTDAASFPRWNSTVSAIEGKIREGQRLRVHVPGTKRVFTPRVSAVVAGTHMIWSDGVPGIFRGVRSFVLTPNAQGVGFAMEERFSGVMFALAKRALPDFRPIFETYVTDLMREAQRIASQR